MNTEEKIEANANLTLWAVHVLGPDDVYAAPSHAAAVQSAAGLNEAVHRSEKTPGDVLCFAYAAPWPHTAHEHAEDLKEWEKRHMPVGAKTEAPHAN